jgi:toxin HigB-1
VKHLSDYGEEGLKGLRDSKGYNDEALKGDRLGQRSIRLNRQWRAIYTQKDRQSFILITLEEVTPHDY